MNGLEGATRGEHLCQSPYFNKVAGLPCFTSVSALFVIGLGCGTGDSKKDKKGIFSLF